MSETMSASTPIIPLFLEGLIRLLMPYFLTTCPDPDRARTEILEALSSYGGRSRAEIINAARIIAYGYAGMETLAEAMAPDVSPAMRQRLKSSANALNRSCLQNEKILEKRLATALPDADPPEAEPIDDLSDADFQAAIEQAEVNIAAYPAPLAASRTPSAPAPAAHTLHWDQATKDGFAALGLSAGAIEAAEKAVQRATASYASGG